MISSTEDLYREFLDGVRHFQTATVPPDKFNRYINKAQDRWVKENLPYVELNQEQIDKLQSIRIITDGVMLYRGQVMYPLAPVADNIFLLPMTSPAALTNDQGRSQFYPFYVRALSVSFIINYGDDDECGMTGDSDWLNPEIMRSDSRNANNDNYYRKPSNRRIFYDIKGNYVYLYTGGATATKMRLEYVRYPRDIWFDQTLPADRVIAGTGEPAHTPGLGSIFSEVHSFYLRDIVEIAVSSYLEETQNPRYQSYLAEMGIKKSTNQ